jgi:hypothetical protein
MKRIARKLRYGLMVAGVLTLFAGCGAPSPEAVAPQDFYSRRSPTPSPISPLDRPGALVSVPGQRATLPPPPPRPRPRGPITGFDESDIQSLGPPAPSTQPATRPGVAAAATTIPTTEPVYAENQYMTLGGIVMVVNGTPIYANKVLRRVLPKLQQYAREFDPYEFEINARAEIEKEIEVLRRDEIEVAAAEQSLDEKQIGIAKGLTLQWRKKQIAEAGGSEQVAMARAEQAEPGENFQDIENDQYRLFLWEVYKAFKIDPDIQFTAEDERDYYTSHINEFTTPSKATIILIEADPARHGGDVGAKGRLQDIRQRAENGEDFANYARSENDLPGASGPQGTGGVFTDIKPKSLVFTNVDAEIWKLPVGHVSDIIADHGAYYLFKLMSRETGETRAFADAAVQEYIKRRLSALKFDQQRQAEIEKLNEQGIANVPDPNMIDVAVEMAKQNYSMWHSAKSAATTKPEARIPKNESSASTQ